MNIANNGRDPLIVHQSCFWLAPRMLSRVADDCPQTEGEHPDTHDRCP